MAAELAANLPGGDSFVTPAKVSDRPAQHTEATQQFRAQVGHISRQSGVFFLGTLFTTGLGYLFKVYLARALGPQDLGLYALGMTIIGFLGIFNSLGLPQSAVRFVASYKAAGRHQELHALLWPGAGLLLAVNAALAGVLLLVGKWIAVRFYHAPALVHYLPLFAAIMLFGVVNGFYGKVLAGYRDIKVRTWIVNFTGVPLNMAVAIVLISGGMGLRGYLSAQILSAALVATLLLVAVWRVTPAAARIFRQPGSIPHKEVWSFSAAMLGLSFLEFLVSQVDKIALGFYRGAREVGIYSVAAALVVYVPLVLSSINQIFAPTIADLHTRGQHALLARLFQSLTKWIIAVTLPLAMVVIVFARPLMRIFGHDFEVGWPILIIGTIGQLVNCGVGSVGYLLVMSGNERRLVKVQIAMALLMVLACAVLVPLFGIIGAATAAAVTNIAMNVLNLWQVRKALGISPYNRGWLRLIAPTLVCLAAIVALDRYASVFHHDWLAVGIALAVAYSLFAAIVVLTGLDGDDRLIASAMWSRVRRTRTRGGASA
jgi:O-antigen/teichoic acid export membrane protein